MTRLSAIGEKLAHLRAKRGWTLKELSNLSGVSVSHISAIENGTRPNPSFRHVVKLAHAFSMSLAYFDEWAAVEPLVVREAQTVSLPDFQTHERFEQLYDQPLQSFLLSESAQPYVALAHRLATQKQELTPSQLLNIIAEFMQHQQNDRGTK